MQEFVIKLITERVAQPTAQEVRAARTRADLTQTQAAQLVSAAQTKPYATWQSYEVEEGNSRHRSIPLATWELFLLLTGQHPGMHVKPGSKPAC